MRLPCRGVGRGALLLKTRLFIIGFFLCLTVFFFARGCAGEKQSVSASPDSFISRSDDNFQFFPLSHIDFSGVKNLPGGLVEVPGGVVAFGNRDDLDRIGKLISSIDQVPISCILDVSLVVVDVSNGLSCGYDVLLSSFSDYASGFELSYDASGGFLRFDGDFGQFLTALQSSSGSVKLEGRSQLYLTEGESSRIVNGERRAVVTQSNITESGAINSTYQYINIGVSLDAEILSGSDDDIVKIRLRQTADSVAGFSEVSGDSVPVIGNREVSTVLSLPYGRSVIIGGLRRDVVSDSVRGVPGLMRLPYLGRFFSSVEKISSSSELLVVLRPVVSQSKN